MAEKNQTNANIDASTTTLTGLGKELISSDQYRIKLDQTVKKILAYKPLLAMIIKETVSECLGMSLSEIEQCIEGDVLISKVYIDGGLTNAGERIDGLSTESFLNDEGLDKYDIRTYMRIPDGATDKTIKILLNLEAQNDESPGYDIPVRALFYCCRMISAQQGVEFTTDSDDPVKYGNIKKVYSIWLCTETAQKRANSIERYFLNRDFLIGNNDDTPRYDILSAVLINLSKKHDHQNTESDLIRMLTDLFDERINGVDKVSLLKNNYGLKVTKEIQEETKEMCNYAEAIEKKGIEKGIQQGIQQGVLNEKTSTLERVTLNYMKIDPSLTRQEAEEKAKAILS